MDTIRKRSLANVSKTIVSEATLPGLPKDKSKRGRFLEKAEC
jgi:hypothetical protein